MGYETKAIFVSSNQDFKGYCSIEASLDMGKIAGDEVGDLMNKARRNGDLKPDIKKWEDTHDSIYCEGNYTERLKEMSESKRRKEVDKLFELQKKLDEKLPYIYERSGDKHDYSDLYGDPLLMVDLKDFRRAVVENQKTLIADGTYEKPGYRRFNMVLKMIDMFDKKIWGAQPVKIILWGY